jgi:hypothetical protein
MKTFSDTAGRIWTLAMNAAQMKRVKAMLQLDLWGMVQDKDNPLGKVAEVVADPVQLCDLLYVLCIDQAKAEKVSDEDFGRAMGGDTLEAAANAFLEEFVDFFPHAKARKAARKMISTLSTIRERVADKALASLESIDLDKAIESLLNGYSGGVQASSVSIQAASPSENY